MNNQMEQVWRSKDGQCTGSKEEVEAYLKSKNSLAGMRFPYTWKEIHPSCTIKEELANGETAAFVAFANLAPLIQETLEAWDRQWAPINWRTHVMSANAASQKLLLAYEEALKQVPQ